jgi:hypothetical protein
MMGEPRMANSICCWQCPEDWAEWSRWLAAGLHARNRWRLPVLLVGILFARGRRTVSAVRSTLPAVRTSSTDFKLSASSD